MQAVAAASALLTMAVLASAPASAQEGAIVGRVLDTASDALPGVTVQAVGPAQVEPRLEVTDREGRYRIDHLPPGRYVVFFTLPGFGSVVRDGIDVGADLATTVDAEMSVGGIGDESFPVWPRRRLPSLPQGAPSGPSMVGAAALECTNLPDGAIVDCRGVTVTGILQWR